VVSKVQNVIPEQVKAKWHEFRQGSKESKQGETTVPEGAEVVGWGVKEADERKAQEGASKWFSAGDAGSGEHANNMGQAWRHNWRSRMPSTRASSSCGSP